MCHLPPAVSPPLAAGHIDHEVAILLIVEDPWVVRGVRACAGGEGVDHPLRDECSSSADPGLICVEVFL